MLKELVIFLCLSMGNCFGHIKNRILRETDLGTDPKGHFYRFYFLSVPIFNVCLLHRAALE